MNIYYLHLILINSLIVLYIACASTAKLDY